MAMQKKRMVTVTNVGMFYFCAGHANHEDYQGHELNP
jgi:hypothetical protein